MIALSLRQLSDSQTVCLPACQVSLCALQRCRSALSELPHGAFRCRQRNIVSGHKKFDFAGRMCTVHLCPCMYALLRTLYGCFDWRDGEGFPLPRIQHQAILCMYCGAWRETEHNQVRQLFCVSEAGRMGKINYSACLLLVLSSHAHLSSCPHAPGK